jgi:pimeloyl-ACP methyl ester carboxylesterase
MIVPENRDRMPADGNTVRLAVVALRAPGVHYDQPPTVLLGSGPGQDVVGLFAGFFSDYAAPKTRPYPPEAYPGHWKDLQAFEQVIDLLVADLQKREFVYFDQRGAGYSEPVLRCHAERWDACRERLAAAGVDLAAYNTSENADDVNDLRLVLGYDQINLQGGSYGTRLALEVMRRHPAIVRAAVLDGVVPPQTYWSTEMVRRYADALQVLFDHCQADLRCNAAYPDLESVFYRQVARLNARSLEVPVGDHQELYDGDDLRDTVWNALWDAHTIPFVPMLIAQRARSRQLSWTTLAARPIQAASLPWT